MKNSFKKFAAIALSSLGILALSPSAFCSKLMNSRRFAMKEMPKRMVVVQNQGDLFPGRYTTPIYGNLIAPYITGVVKKGAFRNHIFNRKFEMHIPKNISRLQPECNNKFRRI